MEKLTLSKSSKKARCSGGRCAMPSASATGCAPGLPDAPPAAADSTTESSTDATKITDFVLDRCARSRPWGKGSSRLLLLPARPSAVALNNEV